jgi:hypothetical protein
MVGAGGAVVSFPNKWTDNIQCLSECSDISYIPLPFLNLSFLQLFPEGNHFLLEKKRGTQFEGEKGKAAQYSCKNSHSTKQ